jgi:hypothetical protein
MKKKPWVLQVLQVSFETVKFMGCEGYVPVMGAVYTGMGTVWENPNPCQTLAMFGISLVLPISHVVSYFLDHTLGTTELSYKHCHWLHHMLWYGRLL